MIERIQKIKNIGTFKDAQIARFPFQKITLVYGGNSQGKSTLCDIIKSLNGNSPEYIEERKTVGATGEPHVDISFGNGRSAKYSAGAWTVSADTPEAHSIAVFDSEFVQDNVFTNSTIDRRNKEEFTKFILGSDSIAIERQLVDLQTDRTKLDDANKDIERRLLPITGMPMKDLIALPHQADTNDEDVACLGLDQNIKNLKKDLTDIEAIKALPRPTVLAFTDSITSVYKGINDILSACYDFSHGDIVTRFNEHKAKFGATSVDFDKWASKGRQIQTDNSCPYCGSEVSDNTLVGSYLTLFCDEFIGFTSKVDSLQPDRLPRDVFSKIKALLSNNESKIESIGAKVYADNADELVKKLRSAKEKLLGVFELCDGLIGQCNETISQKITEKKRSKYAVVSPADIAEVERQIGEVFPIVSTYNESLNEFVALAENYFATLSVESITARISEFGTELARLTAIVNRNRFNDQVLEYQVNELNSKIKLEKSHLLKAEFDTTQARFLETFFADIDAYYTRLGSRNYRIEKDTNGRGTNKVYTVKLFYRDKEVASDRIKYVLSDSDKRALALSIFLSKLKHNPALSNTIVVMDDPITSFDNERMTLFINILKEFEGANQIIILTHYKEFYKKIVELMYATQPAPSLLKIVFLPNSNSFDNVDKQSDALLMGDYEYYLHTMSAFIRGEIHVYSSTDARLLMQKYLEYRFYHEIKARTLNRSKLEDFITALKDAGIITSDDIVRRLHEKREEYNVNAHSFDTESEDAKRNSIVDLQRLLNAI